MQQFPWNLDQMLLLTQEIYAEKNITIHKKVMFNKVEWQEKSIEHSKKKKYGKTRQDSSWFH